MLECNPASSSDSLFAHTLSSFPSSDTEPQSPDHLPCEIAVNIGDYALFLLEQQEGYCQLV